MFDTDGNKLIDYDEFKVLEQIFRQSAENTVEQVSLTFTFIWFTNFCFLKFMFVVGMSKNYRGAVIRYKKGPTIR